MERNRRNVVALSLETEGVAFDVSESIGSKYVFFGNRHNYYKKINKAYDDSVTNQTSINSIITWIYGNGLDSENQEKLDLIKKLFKPKDLKLIARDYKKYGASCFQVAYTGTGKGRKVAKVKHHPVYKIVKGKKNKMDETDFYYHSNNWDSHNAKIVKIPAFGTSAAKLELYYIDGANTSDDMYYSRVDYHSSLKYSDSEGSIADYHVSNIKNGFTPGLLINFNNGIPETDELQYEIEQDVINKWGGTNNAGKIIISFNDSSENAPTIESVPVADIDRIYEYTATESQSKILMSHRITSPLLLGIPVKTGFSSSADELESAYKLFTATVIKAYQESLLEAINDVLEVNNLDDEELYFIPMVPVDFFSKEIQEEIIKEDNADEVTKIAD